MITDAFRQEIAKDRKVLEVTKEMSGKVEEAMKAMCWVRENAGVEFADDSQSVIDEMQGMRLTMHRGSDYARGHIDALEWALHTLKANGYE